MKRWGIYISLFVLMASVFGCTDERLVNDTSGEIKVTELWIHRRERPMR